MLFILVFSIGFAGSLMAANYVGSDACFKCHPQQYNDFKVSGHPYKLQKAETAKYRPLPLPAGYSWDDISYVIGGATKKTRYMDKKGYIITAAKDGSELKTQYNIETGTWSFYEKGKKKPYDCGECHTTGYKKEGNQDNLEGIIGTWVLPGIQCEACHGAGGEHVKSGNKAKIAVDRSSDACGQCHIRDSKDKIPAKDGFIQHHEQYNELLASSHRSFACVTCHNPHKKAQFSIKQYCSECHGKQVEDYKGTIMESVGVNCVDCHMPMAVKSAVAKGKYEADIRAHLFKINIDPKAEMFYKEPKLDNKGNIVIGKDGKPELNEFAREFVTMEFACLNCHRNKDKGWAISKAKGIHKYGKM